MTVPLGGTTVLDLSDEPVAFGARLLADLGADVIRAEASEGDWLRRRGPFVDGVEDAERGLAHLLYNGGKRSVALALDREEAWAALAKLVSRVDIVVAPLEKHGQCETFFRSGHLESLAPGAGIVEPVFRRNSSERAATDLIGCAAGGLLVLNGYPEDPPNHPAGNLAYKQTSLAAALAAVSLLLERAATGRGGRVEVSMQEAVTWTTIQSANENYWYWHQARPTRRGIEGLGGQTIFEAKDGGWVSFYQHPPAWERFVEWVTEALGETLFSEPEWSDGLFRYYHHEEIAAATGTLCASMSRDEVVAEGQRRGILVVPVQGAGDIARDPHLRDRRFFAEVFYEQLGRALEMPRPPFISSAYEVRPARAPVLGEHTREVLTEFAGLDETEVDALEAEGIVHCASSGVTR